MNKPLVAFFAALCIFGYGVALSAPINQGSVKGDKADAWAVTQNGRTQYFWADVGGDGAPDAFFAMHGVRYRRVEIDLDQDGRADLVTLLDHKGEYRHFTDDDRDGLWQPVAPSSILEKSTWTTIRKNGRHLNRQNSGTDLCKARRTEKYPSSCA